jgi:hypothetical protein
MPGHFGLWGIGGPLIVVEISGPRVSVRLRPNFLAKLLGVAPLVAEPGSGLVVTTAQVRMGWGWYLRFRLPGERNYSFMTTAAKKNEMLSCLAEAGFEVPVQEE